MRHDRGVLLSSKVQLSLTYTFSACLRSLQMFWASLFLLLLVRKLKGKRWFQNRTCCKIYKTLAARYCSFLQYLPLQTAGLPLRPLASTLGCNASQSYFSSENSKVMSRVLPVNLNEKKVVEFRIALLNEVRQLVSTFLSQITASFRTWTATAVSWFSSWHMPRTELILSGLQHPGPFCGPPNLVLKQCRRVFLRRKVAGESN